jgi:Rod binding domain-containing protein
MDGKTDILLGVSNAADPARFREAVSKLRAIAPDQGEFSTMLAANSKAPADKGSSSGPEDAISAPASSATPGTKATVAPKSSGGLTDVFNQLEAFIMQTFIQSMLPKDAPAVYGKGTAGDVWKGMLAEKMGNEVAKSGQLGIAKRLSSTAITGSTLARTPPAAVMPQNMMMAGLVNKPAPAPAGFAQALTALQETQAAKPPVRTLHAWATTVEKEPWATTVTKEQG